MSPAERFAIRLDVTIRPCREEDLPALEWFGLFAPDRGLIRRVYQQHRRGEAVMLVAEVNGEASGQLWIELPAPDAAGIPELWAVRVLPCLQRQGIGARMVRVAETMLRARGWPRVQLKVETDNPAARRLYERLGYALAATTTTVDPPERSDRQQRTQWLMQKELQGATRT